MKGLRACFRPCLGTSNKIRPPTNIARAYSDFGHAFRVLSGGANPSARNDEGGTVSLGRSPKSFSRCFGGLSVTSALAKEHDSNLGQHALDHRWPRLVNVGANVTSCREFHERYKTIIRGQTEPEEVQVRGRVWAFRTAGNKLAFVDLVQDDVKLQVVCNYQGLEQGGIGPGEFRTFVDDLKRGDIISVTGHPHRTSRNELSILLSKIPVLLSSCVRPLPTELKNEESRMRLRHVDLLIRPQAARVLKLGSDIKKFLREFLEGEGHISVKTPILADAAGGAVARPFYTKGFEERSMALRIAPELWLKRLIIGGFERIYEIGPSFRNEGIDLLHNPEFETCEFYRTYTDLEELMYITEQILNQMSIKLNVLEYLDFTPPYHRVDFISSIEAEMGCELPHLSNPDSDPVPTLLELMQDRFIGIPEKPTLPRLLDKLCSHYLEPRCQEPTWIINHPECLSPLSKSFIHKPSGQVVAARAELFVHKQEIVNTYEEENSPVAQRIKFFNQLKYNNAEDIDEKLDESYLEALEYGMPPTGGWGCGIERLTMLFGGTKRIADTLAFGTLKNVVALGSHERTSLPSHGKAITDDSAQQAINIPGKKDENND